MTNDRLGMAVSEAELAALAAYARTGDRRQAAAELGVAYHVIIQRLGWTYAKLGVYGAINAFRAVGWLRPPERQS